MWCHSHTSSPLVSLLVSVLLTTISTSSKFNAGIINLVASEGAARGDVVGTLDSLNISIPPSEPGDKPIFVLQDTTYFKLTGRGHKTVVVNRLLDRDNDRKLCREPSWPEVCAWSGVLFAYDGVVLSLRITVTDVNDNEPHWPESALGKPAGGQDREPSIELLIAENTPIGSMFDLPLAEDRDYGKNGIVNYELVGKSKNGRFSLICTTGPNGVIPRLQVLEALDREEKEEYQMQIAAIDGDGQSCQVGLRVLVVDENDNPPIFSHLRNSSGDKAREARFMIQINESLSVGSALPLHPVATDADSGDFGRVRYRFSFSTPEYVRRDFEIEPKTGKIIVQNALDCDAGGISEYIFSMVAEDSAPQPLTTLTTVVITVHDVNDNAPIISLTPAAPKLDSVFDTTLYPTYEETRDSFCLMEEMPSGQLVATVAVNDPDSDADGEFECKLDASKDFGLQALPWMGSMKVYQLLSARRFDREVEAVTSVTLKCTDRGSPPQFSSKIIPITLIDINDNRPYFQQAIYQFTIQENRPPGTLVGCVVAQDNDAGPNGQISFTLSSKTGLHQHLFSINGKGEIRSNEVLDRESIHQGLLFTVIAEDKGKPVYRASAEVTIEIEDVNDCVPTFGLQNYHFYIDEDVEPYRRQIREVGVVQATDCDLGPNADIHYFFEEIDSPFEVSSNGTIFAVRRLDREEQSVYQLSIVARDSPSIRSSSKSLNSTAYVRISINDLNDHSPVFIFPRLNTSVVALPEIKISAQEPIGHKIARLQAKDADFGVNADIRYSLSSESGDSSAVGGTEKPFHLSEDTGELFISSKLPTSQEMRYPLRIHAQDGGIPPRSSSLGLVVVSDPSLAAAAVLAYSDDSSQSNSGGDNLTNIYFIIIIAFGVTIAFVVLSITICLMSRSGKCCSGASLSHGKPTHLEAVEAMSFYKPGSSQLPNHSTPIGSSDPPDYMNSAESTTFALEKGSPMQRQQINGVLLSPPGRLSMNTFYDHTLEKGFCEHTQIATPIGNSVYVSYTSGNGVANFDRFSSLGRAPHSAGYTPAGSLCLVNEGCPEAYFGQGGPMSSATATGTAVYSWCNNSAGQKMQTFNPVSSYAW